MKEQSIAALGSEREKIYWDIGVSGVHRMDVKYCTGRYHKRRVMFIDRPGIAKGSCRKTRSIKTTLLERDDARG
jgi:hypothetical protein